MIKVDFTIDINDSVYLRDPMKTTLGKKLIKHAIELIMEVGFEHINFKKLASRIESTEASMYRYFESKYQLLAYLVAWYWDFMHFLVLMDVRNLTIPKDRLLQAVSTLVHSRNNIMTPDYIDQALLHMVVVENANRVYHTKNADAHNTEGYYANYKKIVGTLANMIKDIDPEFKYPIALATNIIEQSLNNEYYLDHLPSLTDKSTDDQSAREATISMIEYMLHRIL